VKLTAQHRKTSPGPVHYFDVGTSDMPEWIDAHFVDGKCIAKVQKSGDWITINSALHRDVVEACRRVALPNGWTL
jgi:hypothetical protein